MTEGVFGRALHKVGGAFMEWSFEVGGIALLSWRILRALVPPRMDGPETWSNLYRVGVKSFPIVVVTAIFTGAIMVIQSGLYIERYGAYGLLGWGAGFSVLREVGPVMIGLMFSGRVGANNTAELGTMQVTDQIDALRALAIDPIPYLVVPRFVAMVLMLFLLVVIGDVTALVGGALTGQALLGVDVEVFSWSILTFITLEDLFSGLAKAVAFGVAIGIVSCHFGLTVSGGAVGVGRAVNNSVVASAIGIFLLDYFLTWIFQ
jgi:phospholipid/cholesterol/gamma-HCH transport system permease protein